MAEKKRRARGATIVDVAARAGVSPMTVSRVINNQAGVRAETRVVVADAIQALSYTPNTAARSLVTSGELRIGVIYSNPSAAFMSEFLTGIYEEASAQGAQLFLLKGEGGAPPSAEAIQAFVGTGLSGVILAPPLGESARVIDMLHKAAVPLAAVGAYDVAGTACVRIDDRRAAYELTMHLIELGHRRLGFVVGNPDQAASAERLAGFYAAVREAGDAEVRLAQGDFSYASGLAAGEQLLDAPLPPTAVFASNDDMAAAVVSVAHRRQLEVPRMLTVVGFDDSAAAVTLWPPLTTIGQPIRRLAAEALAEVARAGAAPRKADETGREKILDHVLIKRSSTAPPRTEAAPSTTSRPS